MHFNGNALNSGPTLREDLYKAVDGPSTRPIVLDLLCCSFLQTKEGQRRSEIHLVGLENRIKKKNLRRRQYDPAIIEWTICLVFGPFTALYR